MEGLGYHVPTAKVRLLSPQVLIKKEGGQFKTWKTRHFVLLNGGLYEKEYISSALITYFIII